jgi:hypothetical protein
MKTSSLVISRILSLSVMSIMMVPLAGADCTTGTGPADQDPGDIAFVFPRDGDVLNQADDADGDLSNGIQVDPPVRVAYEGETGTELTLTSDQGESATATVDDDGYARFSGFTVNGDEDGTPVTLTVTDGNLEDEIDIEVIGGGDTPPVCTITAPSNGAALDIILDDAAINADGFQVQVEVECSGVDEGTDVEISVEGTVAQTVQLDANGDAQAVVTLPNTDAGNNSNDISISVDDLTDEITVTVVSNQPMPSIDTVDSPADGAAYGPSDDTDGVDDDVITLPFIGTSTDLANAAYDLTCSNGESATGVALTIAPNGDLSGNVAGLSFSPPNDCSLTVSGDDGNGNDADDVTVSFTVASIAIDIAFPCDADANGFLVASEDEDTGSADVMDCDVQVTPTFGGGSWTASAQVWDLATDTAVGAAQDLGSLTSGTAAVVDMSVPFSDRNPYEIRVSATNSSDVVDASAGMIIDTVAPTLSAIQPSDGEVLNASDDVAAAPGFQLAFSIGATTQNNQMGTIELTGADTQTLTCTVTSSPAGVCPVTATLIDGDYTMTVNIADQAGNAAEELEITFTVDATAPAVDTIDVLVDTQLADGTPGKDNWVNLAEAGAAGAAASDIAVTLDADAGLADGVTLTLTVDPAGASYAATVASNVATFTGVTLPEGSNTLTVSGTDAAGNPLQVAGSTLGLDVDTIAPTVVIAAPTAASITAATVDFIVTTDAEDGTDVILEDITAGTTLGTQQASGGSATFTGVALSQGNVDVRASVTDAAGNTNTDQRSYDVDSQAPVLGLSLVSDPGTDADTGTPGWQVTFEVTHTDIETGQTLSLNSSLPEGVVGSAPADASGTTTITATFTSSGQRNVTAMGTDLAGNTGMSMPVLVDIVTGDYDVFVDSPAQAGGALQFSAVEVSGTTATLVLDVPGIAPGAAVDLLINGVSEPSQAASIVGDIVTITFTVAEGQSGNLEVTIDDGVTTGDTGLRSFVIDAVAPTVAWAAGTPTVFTRAEDLQPGTPGLQASVTIDVTECENGAVEVREGMTVIGGPENVGASGSGAIAVAISDASQHDGVAWTAECVDLAGNSQTGDLTTTVDVVAPTAPTLTLTVLDDRRGQIQIEFVTPGDDGNAGAAATIEIVTSRGTLNSGTFDTVLAATPTPGVGGLLETTTTATPGDAYTTQTNFLAFDNTWNIGVRVTDDVGNVSHSFDSATLSMLSTAINNTEDDPAPGDAQADAFGYATIASGDFDCDGVDDLAVAATNEGANCAFGPCSGAVHIYSGVTDLSTLAETAYREGDAAQIGFGSNLVAVQDMNGDGCDELLAQSLRIDDFSFAARFDLYYGNSTTVLDASPVTFLPGAGIDAINPVGDVNGDGLGDLLGGGSAATTAYLVFGETTKLTGPYQFGTTNPPTFTNLVVGTSGNANLGLYAAPLGNLEGDLSGTMDDLDDFAMWTDDEIHILRGRETWPASYDLADTPAVDQIACLGADCATNYGVGDLDNDGDVDLAIYRVGRVNVFLQNADNQFPATRSYRISPCGSAGTNVRDAFGLIGDVNGDGYGDIMVGCDEDGGDPSHFEVFLGNDLNVDRSDVDVRYDFAWAGAEWGHVNTCGNIDGAASAEPELCMGVTTGDGSVTIQY